MTSTIEAPTNATPALVLERWNSWVRVFLPETQETRWVNLQEHEYDSLEDEDELDQSS
jgi:hypothetical protein